MAAEADWSKLPKDLLNLISQRINNELDFIRFRSVCSNWRSFSIPNHLTNTLPFKFPLIRNSFINSNIDNEVSDQFCYLSKRIIFLIKPPPQQDHPWLIRVTQSSSGKTKLYKSPLFKFQLPSLLPFSIDLNDSSVLNLGTDFIIDKAVDHHYLYPTKVVVVTPLILAILLCNGRLVLLRCGDERWTVIPEMSLYIVDICAFKGRIYLVDAFGGMTVTVGPEDLSVRLVANYKDVHGGHSDLRFLVESEGELLLVDVYESISRFELTTIYVFRLDEKKKAWVKLKSLGDRVLFWRKGCSFSASASDLSVAKGNCVIFMDDVFNGDKICDSGMCVFDLDQDRCSPLSDYPDYLNLFWPPPESIVKSCMSKTKTGVNKRKRM